MTKISITQSNLNHSNRTQNTYIYQFFSHLLSRVTIAKLLYPLVFSLLMLVMSNAAKAQDCPTEDASAVVASMLGFNVDEWTWQKGEATTSIDFGNFVCNVVYYYCYKKGVEKKTYLFNNSSNYPKSI